MHYAPTYSSRAALATSLTVRPSAFAFALVSDPKVARATHRAAFSCRPVSSGVVPCSRVSSRREEDVSKRESLGHPTCTDRAMSQSSFRTAAVVSGK